MTSLAWIDFDDVKQIIRTHLFKKWDQWDQQRPLRPWLNRIITNQLKNILRNYYSNFAKPCLSCPFNQSGVAEDNVSGLCGFTKKGTQCSNALCMPNGKKLKAAYDIKMAVTLESHIHEVGEARGNSFEIEEAERKLHEEMKKVLSEKNYSIYQMLLFRIWAKKT